MRGLNPFRVIADLSHTVSKCTLIWAIHSNASAEGVSLITQILYAIVFCTRYMDLFWSHPFSFKENAENDRVVLGLWNFFLKIFYILSSIYIIFIMMRVYGRTHERERAWNFAYACLGGSLVAAPFAMLALTPRDIWKFFEFIWTFSIILESVCILPQLLLLRQTTVPTVIDSFYLVTMGCYRFFYILNWIFPEEGRTYIPLVSLIFGIIQTAFYIDFAWVYYSRQRVKLRNGALVDGEDFTKGWLVNKILNRAGFKTNDYDEPVDGRNRNVDPENAFGSDEHEPAPVPQGRWGKRGISISADDEDDETPAPKPKASNSGPINSNERTGMLDDLDDLDDDAEETGHAGAAGSEWK